MGRAVARGLRLTDNAWRFLEAWTDAVELERSGAATGGATGGTRYDARQPV
jgi:hypothetical protein